VKEQITEFINIQEHHNIIQIHQSINPFFRLHILSPKQDISKAQNINELEILETRHDSILLTSLLKHIIINPDESIATISLHHTLHHVYT